MPGVRMHTLYTLPLLVVIFCSCGFTSSSHLLNGLAVVEVRTGGLLLNETNGITERIETSLEQLLSPGTLTLLQSKSSQTPSSDHALVIMPFIATFDTLDDIPTCLSNNTHRGNGNTSLVIKTVHLQTFHNKVLLENQCFLEGREFGFIMYEEKNCQFSSLDCEPDGLMYHARSYEIFESGSRLFSFFCLHSISEDEEPCLSVELPLLWNHTCDLMSDVRGSFSTPPLPPHDYAAHNGVNDSRIDTLNQQVFLFNCTPMPTPQIIADLPIINLSGDSTWDVLPEWLQECIYIFNILSLVVSLFCLVTFGVFAELRNTYGKIVICLLMTLITSLLYTSGYIPLNDAVHNTPLCVFVATTLYYMVVLPSYWWTCVTIFLAWTLGRKGIHRMSEDSSRRLFLLLSLFGWGVPLLFTLIALFLHIGGVNYFNTEYFCWVEPGWPNTVLTVQTFLPSIVDLFLFVVVLHRLRMTRRELAEFRAATTKSSNTWDNQLLTIKMAGIFGIFWLPAWVTYILFLFLRNDGLAVASQVLNQLTSFVLPIVLCCNRRVMRLWRQKLAPLTESIMHTKNTTVPTPLPTLNSADHSSSPRHAPSEEGNGRASDDRPDPQNIQITSQ